MAEKRSKKEEVEDKTDKILKKVLQVTLIQQQADLVYLELLAAELLSEGKNLVLTKDSLERVLMDRLSASTGTSETPFVYLVGCYRRALEESRKIQSMKDKQILAEIQSTLNQVKELCVSYAGNTCLYPDMFPQPAKSPSDRHSDLLKLILGNPSVGFDPGTSGSGFNEPTLPAGFLDQFIERFKDEGLGEIFNPVFRDLQISVNKVSPLGPFQGPLGALIMLVNKPALAKVLVNHYWWHPRGEHVNGRVLEAGSILGPFFHISAIPDHPVFGNGEPNVG
jgi:ubiquitin conjugation factor E4 B